MSKTEGEIIFEKYLDSKNLHWLYEEQKGDKKPDYLIFSTPNNIVAEVKDFNDGPLEKFISKQLNSNKMAEWTPSYKTEYARVREKVNASIKQLREIEGNDLSLVVLYKPQRVFTFDLEPRAVLSAMYGDLEPQFYRDDKGDYGMRLVANPQKAKMRRNQNTKISAVAILKDDNSGYLTLTVIHNIFAKNKLPINIFNGPQDENVVPDEKTGLVSWR